MPSLAARTRGTCNWFGRRAEKINLSIRKRGAGNFWKSSVDATALLLRFRKKNRGKRGWITLLAMKRGTKEG